MNGTVWLAAGGVLLLAGGAILLLHWWRPRTDGAPLALAGTFLVSLGLLGAVAGLLLFEPDTTAVDALKTGGLAGGAVVALYALWLNDRRRRVEESRQQLENERAEHDREKSADERFARAVELLGQEADQARVGAVAALAGVARARPEYTQVVLDVLCAYLRRPFDHPRYQLHQGEWDRARTEEAERELQVRLSAQRVIADLLPDVGDPDGIEYSLDLTGAALEYFRLRDRMVGTLVLRYATLFSSNDFSGSVFRRNVWLTAATVRGGRLDGQLLCRDVTFGKRAWFSGFTAKGRVLFTGTSFHGPAKFSGSEFSGETDFTGCTFAEPPLDPPVQARARC
ncbi:pentapeptide repeat-containing protein [Amycolatopsis cihanbeyliensis]|uniref:Pentapeptide repeat protein n=1 Tax=Amycolatopsis cihanbeyliensis TaxID=1128664 RepID=A0A542DC63_AMYCI|nr:pentapeptide repeat-containing protein [Amycolatopsis cihanbeyliensis]TQJ00659.1 hypothetical protein FB471_0299 [Amycolatopsis cihanbeyliensis]